MACFLEAFGLLAAVVCIHFVHGESSTWLYNGCNDLDDGLRYIRPAKGENIIPVICSNGFAMLDNSLNFDQYKSYFSSLYLWNETWGGVYGTDCYDTGSWREFWTPSTSDTMFRVAIGCSECLDSESYGDNVAYYSTDYYHCQHQQQKNTCADTESEDNLKYDTDDTATTMCNICDDTSRSTKTGKGWTDCYTLQLNADTETYASQKYCLLKDKVIVRPSISGDRSQCTCFKPTDTKLRKWRMDDDEELPTVSNDYGLKTSGEFEIDDLIVWETSVNTDTVDCDTNVVYWTNADFRDGTVKIKECGEYILTEDIAVNFNGPTDEEKSADDWSPNAYDLDELYWYPTTDQADEDTGEYPGLNTFKGYYHLGFFSAISIQTDNVVVNLNGFELKMDFEYYLQQRFFSLIELGDRPFTTHQGPANFGRDNFVQTSDITIKDGSLGLVAHQGIHGNLVTTLTIDNVNIYDFDVCGIQCNGCNKVSISNAVVGPQHEFIPVLGRYIHGRALIPRLRYFVEEFGDSVVPFGTNNDLKSDVTVTELADDWVKKMDMVYHSIVNGVEYDDDNDDWVRAKDLFVNENGWQDGGSAYGIILNGAGTAVVAFARRKLGAKTHSLTNVEIHGISVAPAERFWTQNDGKRQMQGFFFDTIDWLKIKNSDNTYIGDEYTDILFAANELMSDQICFGNTLYVDRVRNWVFENNVQEFNKIKYYCGSDVQSHDAKGAMGLRIDCVEDITIDNLYIHDITSYGETGDQETCGEYTVVSFLHDIYTDIEPGYTGTRAMGMIADFVKKAKFNNIVIENVESKYGTAYGLGIYKGSTIKTIDNVVISNINAGSSFTSQDDVDDLNLPNHTPEACSVYLGDSDVDDSDDTTSEKAYILEFDDDAVGDSISASSISGWVSCDDDHLLGDMSFTNMLSGDTKRGNTHIVNFNVYWVAALSVLSLLVFFTLYKLYQTNNEKQKEYSLYGTF